MKSDETGAEKGTNDSIDWESIAREELSLEVERYAEDLRAELMELSEAVGCGESVGEDDLRKIRERLSETDQIVTETLVRVGAVSREERYYTMDIKAFRSWVDRKIEKEA